MEVVHLVLKEMEKHAYHRHLVQFHLDKINVQTVAFAVQMLYAFNIQIQLQLAYVKLDIQAADMARMDACSKQLIHVTIFGVKMVVHA